MVFTSEIVPVGLADQLVDSEADSDHRTSEPSTLSQSWQRGKDLHAMAYLYL